MIHFPVSRMNFLSLTEPDYGANGSDSQYQVAVPVGELPVEIVNNMPHAVENTARGRWGLFSIRSQRRPRIFGMTPDNADLAALWRYVSMTQTSIETLLRDQPGVIACSIFEKTSPGSRDPYGVGLNAIRIDPSLISLPSWEDMISGKVPI